MKPGDLVVTRNMGTGSGKIGIVIKSNRSKIAVSPAGEFPIQYRTMELCDVLLRGELVDGIDTHFLRIIKQNETG